MGVAGSEQAQQLGFATVVETFMRFGQQPPGPIQRVVLAAPMPDRLVLDPAATLIQLGVDQSHQAGGVN